jgi:hypothetical protein
MGRKLALSIDVSIHTSELEDAANLSLSRTTCEGMFLYSRRVRKIRNGQRSNLKARLLLSNWSKLRTR